MSHYFLRPYSFFKIVFSLLCSDSIVPIDLFSSSLTVFCHLHWTSPVGFFSSKISIWFFGSYSFSFVAKNLYLSICFNSVLPYFTEDGYNTCFKVFVWYFHNFCNLRVGICCLFPWAVLRFSWFFVCWLILDCILHILNIILWDSGAC